MNIPQITYSKVPAVAFAGQLGDVGSGSKDIESRAAEEAFDCGIFVVAGASGSTCQKITAAGEVVSHKLLGVAIYQAVVAPNKGGSGLRYVAGDMVPILKKGRVWVKVVEAAVTADSLPYIKHTTGEIRGTADAGATIVPASMVKVLIGADPGGVALVEVNLP